jgi:hypothetical protein
MTDQSYREAIDGLAKIREQLDKLIGVYGIQRGQLGWHIVVRARDALFHLEQNFDLFERRGREVER